jgi:two-component system, sensor histidine kinase and response regulator
VVRNLISNAIKYTDERGSIYIQASHRGDKNYFMVKDTGIGMNAETIAALSGPPNYASGYGTQQEKGLGIGLHLCRELLDLVDGEMIIESVEGRGSTFTILLPRV